MSRRFLVDKSALARMRLVPVRQRLAPLIDRGQVATCAMIDLEVLFSARSARDHQEIRQRRSLAHHRLSIDDTVFDRAIEVQGELAKRNLHRVPIADLIIASTAELGNAVVLHYDKDFDIISSVTGQPTEWVVPAGSL